MKSIIEREWCQDEVKIHEKSSLFWGKKIQTSFLFKDAASKKDAGGDDQLVFLNLTPFD